MAESRQEVMTPTAARELFPGLRDKVFLDAACVSLLPVSAAEALDRLRDEMLSCPHRDASAHHIALDRTAQTAREQIACLLHTRPENIALVESTTHGLQIVASSVSLEEGDNILIGSTEFMGLAIPWIPKQHRQGFSIKVVPHREGRLSVDDFARVADSRTRMILLSSVQWNNGFRADLSAFSQFTEEKNIILVVDAIQQLGAIDLDVEKTPCDFLVAGGHKWLNAPVGRGLLYVHPKRRDTLEPAHWGYLNVVEPESGWAEYFATPDIPPVRDYDFTGAARRFETGGTANYPGNVALAASLQLINSIGIQRIEQHIFRLGDRLVDALTSAGVEMISPTEAAARSGIVTFTLGDGPERDKQLLNFLLDRRILLSQRYTAGVGGLRVSVHFFNNEDDILALVDGVRAALKGRQ
ncbi:MAG: aminotransferase [Gemmatales bacterium]|nr:MAG: aminotransferase [Gemmatales bacterium]